MITIGERVRHAIDDIERGDFEFALQDLAIAIDVTAKQFYRKARADRHDYKGLIKEYFWLIELIGLRGANLDDCVFGNFPIQGNPTPGFHDIVYHVIRCSLVHDVGIPDNLQFGDPNVMILDKDRIVFPKDLIWALLAIIVFCPANAHELTADGYWISICGTRFTINEVWGKESVAKAIYDNLKPIRVSIVIDEVARERMGTDGSNEMRFE